MNYNLHEKLFIRTPLLPLKTAFTIQELKELFNKKEIKEALYISSPHLFNELEKWYETDETNNDNYIKITISLLKYALRMHSRCTPFGLYAGCSISKWTDLFQLDTKQQFRQTRLDMNVTAALARLLESRSFIRTNLKYTPNTTIYELGRNLRYVEYYFKNGTRKYQVSSVERSEYLDLVLSKARDGHTISELSSFLIDDEISLEDSEEFINDLITSQVLVSEIEPFVTGPDMLSKIISLLDSMLLEDRDKASLELDLNLLKEIQKQLNLLDEKIGNPIKIYIRIEDILRRLDIPFEKGKLFQVDLYRKINLSEDGSAGFTDVQQSLKDALDVLCRLSPSNKNQDLIDFKNKFIERYEFKEMPLLEAIDIEYGIGYGKKSQEQGDVTPLISDIKFPNRIPSSPQIKWDKKQAFIFQTLIKANQDKSSVVNITKEDVDDLEDNWENLPITMSALFSITGKNEFGQCLITLKNVGNPGAANILGRFGFGDKEITELLKDITSFEQNYFNDKILAEIAHLPQDRLGNILYRPIIRDFEIPFLSNSMLSTENQILLNDLYVSIRNDRIFLRSKKLNKEIIPRMSNSHNYTFGSLPVYKFLCDMQLQDISNGLFFSWGMLQREFKFLPRVEVYNVVVSLAMWNLGRNDFEELFSIEKMVIEKKSKSPNPFLKWKHKFNLPNLFLLIEGDHELLVDFNSLLSIRMFLSTIKKSKAIVLKEFLFDDKECVVKNLNGGSFTNEFVATLTKSNGIENKAKNIQENFIINNPRNFSLGSEWLYYKVYCGIASSDTILKEVVFPLTDRLTDLGLIKKCFFIRYNDPEYHLRVRFHITDNDKLGDAIAIISKEFKYYEENDIIWKIQIDSYKRELERYGDFTVQISEEIFHFDSMCHLQMLRANIDEERRWMFAIKSTDAMLDDFMLTKEEKLLFTQGLRDLFGSEFNVDKEFQLQMDNKYREYRKKITLLLNNDDSIIGSESMQIIKNRSNSIQPLIQSMLNNLSKNKFFVTTNSILSSHIHMVLNRMFRSKQRMHELVIYDFLFRTYKSEIAKAKNIQH